MVFTAVFMTQLRNWHSLGWAAMPSSWAQCCFHTPQRPPCAPSALLQWTRPGFIGELSQLTLLSWGVGKIGIFLLFWGWSCLLVVCALRKGYRSFIWSFSEPRITRKQLKMGKNLYIFVCCSRFCQQCIFSCLAGPAKSRLLLKLTLMLFVTVLTEITHKQIDLFFM